MRLYKYLSLFATLATGGILVVALFLFLTTTQPAFAAPMNLFVTPAGSGDCSQCNPCDLQTALNQAVDGDTLYLAQGAYTGSGGAVITLTKSLGLYGGWDGSAATPIVRNPDNFPSTLDGEDSRHVIYIDETITPTIDGFIITRGKSPDGGGIFINQASPLIQNNEIIHNRTIDDPSTFEDGRGGGIFIGESGNVTIAHNRIISNTSGYGGGIYHNGELSITFSFNEIYENSALHRAGGILVENVSDIIKGNIISGNNAVQDSGGILIWASHSLVEANWIISNTSIHGGGISLGNGSGARVVNNILANNTKSTIAIDSSPPAIINNTIIGNGLSDAGNGIRIYNDSSCTPGYCMEGDIINNIIMNFETAIYAANAITSTIDYNNLWNNSIADFDLPSGVITGTHNISEDPLFVNPTAGDYHLQNGSPCVNAGDQAGVPPAPATDFDGQPRPGGGRVDIGADEIGFSHFLPALFR